MLADFALMHRSDNKVKGSAFMCNDCIKGVTKFWGRKPTSLFCRKFWWLALGAQGG